MYAVARVLTAHQELKLWELRAATFAYTTVAYAVSVDRIGQFPYPVNSCFTEEFDVLDQEDENALLDENL